MGGLKLVMIRMEAAVEDYRAKGRRGRLMRLMSWTRRMN